MSFGSTLREKRLELAIGLTDMAERLGISAAYWSRIERDLESPPSDHLIERAAAILGLRMDDLFVEAQRLPPDMQEDISVAVSVYRQFKAHAS